MAPGPEWAPWRVSRVGAPAFAAADGGIAMDSGPDVAIESAGVTLLHGNLTGIVRARAVSRATMNNVRQNLFFAFAYNVAGAPIAAGVLTDDCAGRDGVVLCIGDCERPCSSSPSTHNSHLQRRTAPTPC